MCLYVWGANGCLMRIILLKKYTGCRKSYHDNLLHNSFNTMFIKMCYTPILTSWGSNLPSKEGLLIQALWHDSDQPCVLVLGNIPSTFKEFILRYITASCSISRIDIHSSYTFPKQFGWLKVYCNKKLVQKKSTAKACSIFGCDYLTVQTHSVATENVNLHQLWL